MLLIQLLALAAMVAAAVVAMLWSSALGERDDAIAARDAALVERDEANRTADQAATELRTATSEIERLEGELTATEADVETLTTQVAELTTEVEDLTAANAALGTQVEELLAQASVAPVGGAFVPAESPEFSRFVGELLSSRSGTGQLTADQQRCLGGAVVQSLGLDGFATGALLPATPETEFVLALAMGNSADACGIDRALIFG